LARLPGGRHDSGGLDIDAAIVEHLAATVPDEAARAPQDALELHRRAASRLISRHLAAHLGWAGD
jgi:hypothetical protein